MFISSTWACSQTLAVGGDKNPVGHTGGNVVNNGTDYSCCDDCKPVAGQQPLLASVPSFRTSRLRNVFISEKGILVE